MHQMRIPDTDYIWRERHCDGQLKEGACPLSALKTSFGRSTNTSSLNARRISTQPISSQKALGFSKKIVRRDVQVTGGVRIKVKFIRLARNYQHKVDEDTSDISIYLWWQFKLVQPLQEQEQQFLGNSNLY